VTAARARSAADRAFAANVLGTLALTIADRTATAASAAARHGAHAPAALVTLLWYPDRPVAFLAARLRISHPGAVQLSTRLAVDGLVRRLPGADGRSVLLSLTAAGERGARAVLAERSAVLDRALDGLDEPAVTRLTEAVCAMLGALTDDLLTSEFMCRMCDEKSCPDDRCPVERAEPSPPHRRGTGYGIRAQGASGRTKRTAGTRGPHGSARAAPNP
jgi:MarR family transcriptional regulator, negative regulator of the multidrug operon emrRAB